MISYKRINLIAIIIVALAFISTVIAMAVKSDVSTSLTGTVSYSNKHAVTYSKDDYYSSYSESSISKIELNGISAASSSKNVSIADGEITIMSGGTYVISGELTNGTIIVDSSDGAEVRLILNNASVVCEDFAALYVKQAGKVIISTIGGTENSFADGTYYNEEKSEDGKPDAAIYSKDDLTINGSGTLVVSGNYKDGIKANDNLKITEGTLKINAVDDGINVNDFISVLAAQIEINSGGDAIKCEHEDEKYGFIALESTSLSIVGDGDGIYASTAIYANNVTASITTGDGAGDTQSQLKNTWRPGGFGFTGNSSVSTDTVSTKAVKAGTEIQINGGKFTIDSLDDSIHSDGNVSIVGGEFTISSGDDAIHAEDNVTLEPDAITISKCYEGIEGAYITINGGDISIISSDDGINAVGLGSSGEFGGFGGGMGMKESKTDEEDMYLTINGGNIYIETRGDGIDSNASVMVNGGYIEVYGPEDNGNASLDFEYSFIITGGKTLAAGSSGMAELPDESSGQNSIVFYLDETYAAESQISIIDNEGNELMSGNASKKFNWICVSVPEITVGENYTLVINAEKVETVESTNVVTSFGSSGRGRRMW